LGCLLWQFQVQRQPELYVLGIGDKPKGDSMNLETKEAMLDYICNPKEARRMDGMKYIIYTIEETIGCVFEDGSDTRETTVKHETYKFSEPWELEEIREGVEVGYYENQDYSYRAKLSHKIISDAELRSVLNEWTYWSA